jgi:hypothetical protein
MDEEQLDALHAPQHDRQMQRRVAMRIPTVRPQLQQLYPYVRTC